MVAADGGLLAVFVSRDAPEYRHAAGLGGIVDLIHRCLQIVSTPWGIVCASDYSAMN